MPSGHVVVAIQGILHRLKRKRKKKNPSTRELRVTCNGGE